MIQLTKIQQEQVNAMFFATLEKWNAKDEKNKLHLLRQAVQTIQFSTAMQTEQELLLIAVAVKFQKRLKKEGRKVYSDILQNAIWDLPF
jgi:hypothetical protein